VCWERISSRYSETRTWYWVGENLKTLWLQPQNCQE